jgi:hypothetical protein
MFRFDLFAFVTRGSFGHAAAALAVAAVLLVRRDT